jgi:hypothetical protein
MNSYSRDDVQNTINELCRKLNVKINPVLQKEYQDGYHPSLLSYEKVEKATIIIPTIQKYLIGAQNYCNQPTNFYDIFRANRHVTLIQFLNRELDIVCEKVANFEKRIQKLASTTDYDDFESCLFEILTAGTYVRNSQVEEVSFIDETNLPSPDLSVIFNKQGEYFVECKKFDREVDFDLTIRDAVRDKTRATLFTFAKLDQSAIIEMSFMIDPCDLDENEILEMCISSLKKNTYIRTHRLAVKVFPMKYEPLDGPTHFPSPRYFWNRYRFRHNSEWHGIVPLLNCQPCNHIDIIRQPIMPKSTWINDVKFECAIKWKIENDDILWKIKRLPYSTLFKALHQLISNSTKSIVHAWTERDYPLGNRQAQLIDFLQRLRTSSREIFSWMVFNETCMEVTPNEAFDFIEHAHIINGPTAFQPEPPVSNVFISQQGIEEGKGEFGVGKVLPDLDSIP